MVAQFYITEAENEYVIKGNSAIVKCKIPSFVTDFVFIEAWVDEEGSELWKNNITNYGSFSNQIFWNSSFDPFLSSDGSYNLSCIVSSFQSWFNPMKQKRTMNTWFGAIRLWWSVKSLPLSLTSFSLIIGWIPMGTITSLTLRRVYSFQDLDWFIVILTASLTQSF